VDGFPITGPPGGTEFLAIRHASETELSHANATPYSDHQGVAGGWANKQRGAQLEAKVSDPIQLEINASYHRLEMVVEYDESKINEDQIISAAKKKGYQAVPV